MYPPLSATCAWSALCSLFFAMSSRRCPVSLLSCSLHSFFHVILHFYVWLSITVVSEHSHSRIRALLSLDHSRIWAHFRASSSTLYLRTTITASTISASTQPSWVWRCVSIIWVQQVDWQSYWKVTWFYSIKQNLLDVCNAFTECTCGMYVLNVFI